MSAPGHPPTRMPSRVLRAWLVNLTLLSASFLLAALVAELAVRVLVPQQLILKRPDIWRPDTLLGFDHQPAVRTTINTGERTVTFVTDDEGFRIAASGRRDGERTVLLLGDSYSEALQVEYEQSFAGLLETNVSRRLGATVGVRNSGVGGWDPDQYLIRARAVLATSPFDLVVVALYVENDAIDYWRKRVPARVPVEVHPFRIPRRLSMAEFKDALFYPINDLLEVRSHLFIFLKNRLQTLRMRWGLTAAYFPRVYRRSEADSPRWDNTAAICAEIAALARQRKVPVLFVLIPAPHQVDSRVFLDYVRGFDIDTTQVDLSQPTRRLEQSLKAKGLVVVDALPTFLEAHGRGLVLYGKVDNHLSPAGHETLAALLEPRVFQALGGR